MYKKILKLIGEIVDKGFVIFAALAFMFMVGFVFLNGVLRYGFNSSFPPSEELAIILFIYVSFLGAILAFRDGNHICVDILVGRLTGKKRMIVDIIADLFSVGAILVVLKGGLIYVEYTRGRVTAALEINYLYISSTVVVMAFFALFIYIIGFKRYFNRDNHLYYAPLEEHHNVSKDGWE